MISVEHNKELELEYFKRAAKTLSCFTECTHIFPESTNLEISGTSDNAADKVYFSPIYLDVFLFIYRHLDIGLLCF